MTNAKNLAVGALVAAVAGTLVAPAAHADTTTAPSAARPSTGQQTAWQRPAPRWQAAQQSSARRIVAQQPSAAVQTVVAQPASGQQSGTAVRGADSRTTVVGHRNIRTTTYGQAQQIQQTSSDAVKPLASTGSSRTAPWSSATDQSSSSTQATEQSTESSAAETAQQGFTFVYQGQGQADQWHDCGPSVALMALDQRHKAPSYFDADHLASSLVRFRAENVKQDPHGGMTVEELQTSMARYGVSTQAVSGDAAADQLEQVKQGKQAITMGQTGIISDENAQAGYAHYIYVRSYDATTGQFVVADPLNKDHRTQKVSESTLRQFINSNTKVNPAQLVMTF